MPFGDPEKDLERFERLTFLYEDCIKEVVENIITRDNQKILCTRADREYRSGEIINDILDNIVNSEIVIADLSGKNPNVFYELGVRHAIKNNTILISDDINDVPFDLRPLRTLSYKYDPKNLKRFKKELSITLTNLLNNPEEIDNPVRRYLFTMESMKILSSPTPPGYDFYKNLITELVVLKEEFKSELGKAYQLIKEISATESTVTHVKQNILELPFFEGHWIDQLSGTNIYAKIINGTLYMPYCYSGDYGLDSHFFDFKIVNNILTAKFKWFNSNIAGNAYFKVIDNDNIEAGWWYEDDLSDKLSTRIILLAINYKKMNEMDIVRIHDQVIPSWAEKYFSKVRNGIY